MLNTKAHPSAETIYNDLKGENPDLSFATVYRNLKLLEELGKIRRVYVGDNVLPTKIAIDYLSQTLLLQSSMLQLASIFGYTVFFLLWTVVIRQKKLLE